MLSLKTEKTVEHIGIYEASDQWVSENVWGIKFQTEFPDAYNVIHHYQNNMGNWGCLLTSPCPREEKKLTTQMSQISVGFDLFGDWAVRIDGLTRFYNRKNLDFFLNADTLNENSLTKRIVICIVKSCFYSLENQYFPSLLF